jgi:hypothetical protein
MPQNSMNPADLRRLIRKELAAALRDVAARLEGAVPRPIGSLATVPVVDPRLMVILTAAAVAALRHPVRVRSITFLNQNTISGWSEMGRMAIHVSHNVHRSH